MRNPIAQVVRARPAGLFVLLVALGSADALSAQDTHDHEHNHHDHGHGTESDDLYEFEPFLTGGVKGESREAISWAILTLPTEGNSALGIEASFLYHLSPRLQALLEYQGDTVLGNVLGSRHVSTLAPALKVRPFAESGLALGAGVRVPLTEHRAFDTGALFSAFYHF